MSIKQFFYDLFGVMSYEDQKKYALELFKSPSVYKDYYSASGTVKPYAKGLHVAEIADILEKRYNKRVFTATIYQVIKDLESDYKIYVASTVENTNIPIYRLVEWRV